MGVKNTKPTIGSSATDGKKRKIKEARQGPDPRGTRHLVLKDGRRRVLEWRK